MRIYIGTSGFAHEEWKGRFYPEKLPAREMLRHYGAQLDSVEINNTFYHLPNGTLLANWASQVPDDFVFALKAPQVITHMKRLHSVSSETGYLFKSLSTLGRKLGPVLFQFPASFRADRQLLEAFLGLIPRNALCAFDFRSPSWLEPGIREALRAKGCGWCLEDTDEHPVEEVFGTAAWGYLRLRRAEYSDADLAAWAERIQAQPWERAFVYFKHEGEVGGAELALRFREIVGSPPADREPKEKNAGRAA